VIKKILLGVLVLALLSIAAGVLVLSQYNNYQATGFIELPMLDNPVRVVRDEQGIPYVYAASLDDVFRGQGFVSAQDRLLQIEFTRYLSTGRLAELIGPAGLKSDIQMRVLGIPRHGRANAAILSDESRGYAQAYLDGYNAYLETMQSEFQLGLRLLGIEPKPWTVEDTMALKYFLSWSSTPNLEAELIAQALIDELGPARAAEISQITVNPDVGIAVPAGANPKFTPSGAPALSAGGWPDEISRDFELGSNQWVFSPKLTKSGGAIVVNNPHINSNNLPGIWHPIGLITPNFRAVGAAGPGSAGLAVGRTSHIAFGVTNANGDGLDLFVEMLDPDNPDHYLEQGVSTPFEIIEETIRILNRSTGAFDEEKLRIRLTKRGPVISDHGMTMDDGRVITARWAAPEGMQPDAGLLGPLLAKTVYEAGLKIAEVNAHYNYIVADKDGNIGHFTAGSVPVRRVGDGSAPVPAYVGEAWDGLIPRADMPGVVNPGRGWVGNANNRTLPADYEYAYSTYFAHSWRYRRMLQLLDTGRPTSAGDHWRFMFDTGNVLAQQLAPMMVDALNESDEDLADILADWDYIDDPKKVAPAVFQVVWRNFARRVYEDELGEELTARMLTLNYYWEERLVSMVKSLDSPWFDDVTTPDRETLGDLLQLAARDAREELAGLLGSDPAGWQWGKIHTVTFFSPLIPGDTAADYLGGGTAPLAGSGETINRGKYKYTEPYRVTYIDSMRFVADMSDEDKVMAVLSGGASGRQFDPHLKDQLPAWRSGEPKYWWFSDAAIKAHAQTELMLAP
jgi:penicillin amidase